MRDSVDYLSLVMRLARDLELSVESLDDEDGSFFRISRVADQLVELPTLPEVHIWLNGYESAFLLRKSLGEKI